MRVPRMNDNPAACSAIWLASEIIPASATTVTSVSWCVDLKVLMIGSIVAVSARLPSKAATVGGNPVASVSRPRVIWGFQAAFLGTPARNPSPASVSKQGGYVEHHQRRRPQSGVLCARGGQRLPPPGLGIDRQATLDGGVRGRLDTDFAQHPARIDFAGRLDDPRQHQITKHGVALGDRLKSQPPGRRRTNRPRDGSSARR